MWHLNAVLFIVCCFGFAHSQRKYNRAPVAADVKTGINFNCPEEFGYYPHPTDCTQYYVCVFGGALLESCTGGLMYSHELQTCDWPRNVGCDGLKVVGSSTSSSSSSPSLTRGRDSDRDRGREREKERERERDEPRTRYSPPPPPPQPAAVVTSRGQPRQLHHSKQEFIKQQQQLYADAEDTLPPAEEVESDRQQRVYRGQPSTVGQVQKDRDGLRHSNVIPTYNGRGEKIGVISFGTQNQHYSHQQGVIKSWQGIHRQKHAAPINPPLSTPYKTTQFFNPSVSDFEFEGTEEFKPFTPNYVFPKNYNYFSLHPKRYETKKLENRYPDINFSKSSNVYSNFLLQPASSNVVPQNHTTNITQSSERITQAITRPYDSLPAANNGTLEQTSNEESRQTPDDTDNTDGVEDDMSSTYEEELEHFSPPPEFYRTENKYEHIKNPFADPNFDFDKFLDGFTTTTTTTTTTTPRPPPPPPPRVPVKLVDNSNLRPVLTHLNHQYDTASTSLKHNSAWNVPVSNNSVKFNIPTKFELNPVHKAQLSATNIDNSQTYQAAKHSNIYNVNEPQVFPNIEMSAKHIKPTLQIPRESLPRAIVPHGNLNDEYLIAPLSKTQASNRPRNKPEQMPVKYSDDIKVKVTTPKVVVNDFFKNTKPIIAKPPPTKLYMNDYYYEYEDEVVQPKKVINNNQTKFFNVQKSELNQKKETPEYEYYYDDEYDYADNKSNNETASTNKITPKVQGNQSHLRPSLNNTDDSQNAQTTLTTYRLPSSTQSLQTKRPASKSPSHVRGRPRLTTRQQNNLDFRQGQSVYYKSDENSAPSPQSTTSTATATSRTNVYNNTHYSGNHYEPYYALYDDDVELYKDVEYPQNNYNTNNSPRTQSATYKGTPAPAVQSTVREEAPKRGSTVYLQNNYNQDIYQQSTVGDYNEDNRYDAQVEDQNTYRQSNRQPSSLREDRNEINDVEEVITKRTTTTTTTRKIPYTPPRTTTTTSPRTTPPKKSVQPLVSRKPVTANENQTQAQSKNHTVLEDLDTTDSPIHPLTSQNISNHTSIKPDLNTVLDLIPNNTLHDELNGKNPTLFSSSNLITTVRPVFHYITKAPENIDQISEEYTVKAKIIVPTTYSPPNFLLKSILLKPVVFTTPFFKAKSIQKPNVNKSLESKFNLHNNTLNAFRQSINPVSVNHALSVNTAANYESAERLASGVVFDNNTSLDAKTFDFEENLKDTSVATTTLNLFVSKLPKKEFNEVSSRGSEIKPNISYDSTTNNEITTNIVTNKPLVSENHLKKLYSQQKTDKNVSYDGDHQTNEKFRTAVELPHLQELLDTKAKAKHQLVQPPIFKPKSTTSRTSFSPTRISRVKPAIKSLIAIGRTRRPNSKCHETESLNSKCNNDLKQRSNSRGRGTTHYGTNIQLVNNEVTVNTNRGTPAPRSRPTLKPSTSIVSKAQEFIDIYRFPPRRPDPIYPQPQPDKTAAKCRKDVCLLPDCSCGGKEIPGDLPVEQVPQMVLLTYDDSVNDLNKGLYQDLFEKGRTNPNGCPIVATFYVSHEWTDYSQVQNLYSDGHEIASHTVSHSFGEQFSQKKWTREVAGQREILSAYGGVHLEDVRGMRAPFLSVGGNKMFKMLYDSNFTYDSSMPIYENKPPSWPYTLDYKLFHDCMIPPCPTRSYPGVWEVPMVMWQDLNGGRCSMGDACSNPSDADGVFKMLMKNFQRHYTTNRAPFGLFYHAAWFTQPHHKEGFINFIDTILAMKDVWFLTNWQAIQWVRDPTPTSRLNSFQPFQCDYSDRPKRCNNPKVCNLWHKSGVRYMRTCQPCPDIYPWTGNSGIRSSRIDNDIED